MILSFKCEDTARIFRRETVRRLPPDIQRAALRKLLLLHAVKAVDELRVPPGNRLERLKGDLAGTWSIRVNDQWRICFQWDGSNAHNVEISDYH